MRSSDYARLHFISPIVQPSVRDALGEIVVVRDEQHAVAESAQSGHRRGELLRGWTASWPIVGSSSMIHGISPENGHSQLSRLRAASGSS